MKDQDRGYQPNDVPGTQAPVDSGHVIYIKDKSAKDTRINDRVMLVLFYNKLFSYACLSFCCHSDFSGETLRHSHALVYADDGQQTAPQSSQAQLRRTIIGLRTHQNFELRTTFSTPHQLLNST
ncbi:hypothetical protein GJ744_006754 [Endocarpon pusillum]|uniref:Uncharacterized protein n=1 Tax=Endocarpon pusillum TaxID=364733 RepID=A0A8H7DY06_9EURO|nr:hypothetical protein GJ744_006754 [Endocarpon pusillum]